MVRQSNRSRKPNGNTNSSGNSMSQRDPVPGAPHPSTHSSLPLRDARGYLQRLYVAIDEIYRRERTEPDTHRLVGDIILQARCARVLTHLEGEGRAVYLHAIRAAIPSLDGQATFIAQQMLRMDGDEITRGRFSNFVDRFGFLLLSVCAHSDSFRKLLESASLTAQDQSHWQELCDLIESHAYSIELYARTRGLDWSTPLTERSDTWDRLVCQSLYDVLNQHSNFTENQVLGISDTEYRIRHELSDSIGHYHEWVVSSKDEPAYNPMITYRTRKRKSSTSVTSPQVNINSSIILPNCKQFKWPKRTGCVDEDPRSRGPASDPCEVCPEHVNNHWAPQHCDHTLAQLCELHHSNIAKASSRIELLQYSEKGIGVRALEAFRKGEILAEYVGEIYPSHVIREGRKESVRLYQTEDGKSYQYEQPMEDCTVDNGQESRKKKKTTSSPDKTVNCMIIDPAIKGNWTRYMNHSCREATCFARRFVGDRVLTLIVAQRDIQFGEEITVNYGPDFWQNLTYGCACQEDECTFWSPDQNKVKGGKRSTWGEEVERKRLAAEGEAAKTASKKRNKKATNKKAIQADIKKPAAQGEKDVDEKPSGARPAPKRRGKGAKRDDEPPTKRARKGAK